MRLTGENRQLQLFDGSVYGGSFPAEEMSSAEKGKKYARAEDVPEHTLAVITTDGMESSD